LLCVRVSAGAAAAAVLVSLCYEIVLRPRHAFYAQYWRFMQDDVRPAVIFLGDSRGVHALRHGTADRNFYNYAHFGEYPFHQILRARHAIRDKPGLRALVMQMDPYVIMQQRAYRPLPSSRGFYEALLYSPLADIRAIIRPTDAELARNAAAFVFPLMLSWEQADFWGAMRQAMTTVGLDNASPRMRFLNACGDLVNQNPSLDRLDRSERIDAARIEATGRYKDNVLDPGIGRIYQDFIAYARQRGVTVIGIQFPQTAEYSDAARPWIDPAATAFIASLAIPVLDYRDAFGDRPEFFTDPDHLSDEGARVLSARVFDDLRRTLKFTTEPPRACRSAEPISASAWPWEFPMRRLITAVFP
jgi:hypothetical protein